ncbi:MAG TPA: ATP-grasp domain-containing protein [Candidatus Adamsella sp.]|nr:ATP-grasp domain-containing protein [Candidatus Adamsella sp.]
MIILDNPYVSPLLEDTVAKKSYPVLNNEMARSLSKFDMMNVLSDEAAVDLLKGEKNPQLYSNSENAINWISTHLNFSELPQKIELFKNKAEFRRLLKEIYPDFYFFESGFDSLSTLDTEKIRFPVVLKPCVGFLSMGVYIIRDAEEWSDVIKNLRDDIEKFRGQFPTEVVDASSFIVEELINGEEFAIDAYFDKDGKPVILNIFKHPFSDETDVSDRVYFTSGEIIKSNHDRFESLLSQIGSLAQLRNFPLHMEVRVDGERVVPIEINPMRFAGWCVTDLAYFAYGIDVYEYYFEQKTPDWEKILKEKGSEFYYFTIAEVPVSVDKSMIREVDYDGFLKNISHPLEVRKIDYRRHPILAIVFAKTDDYSEMSNILKKDMRDFIIIR